MKLITESVWGKSIVNLKVFKKWPVSKQVGHVLGIGERSWLQYINLDKVEPRDRGWLMYSIPELKDRWDIHDVDPSWYKDLICKYPEKIRQFKKRELKVLYWPSILAEHPELASYCNFNWIEGISWVELLEDRPEFIKQFKKFIETHFLDVDVWARILFGHPQLAKYAPVSDDEDPLRDVRRFIMAVADPVHFKIKPTDLSIEDWYELFCKGDWVSQSLLPGWLAWQMKRLAPLLEWPPTKRKVSREDKKEYVAPHGDVVREIVGMIPLSIVEAGIWFREERLKCLRFFTCPKVLKGRYLLYMPRTDPKADKNRQYGVILGSCVFKQLKVARKFKKKQYFISPDKFHIYRKPIVVDSDQKAERVSEASVKQRQHLTGKPSWDERWVLENEEISLPDLNPVKIPSGIMGKIKDAELHSGPLCDCHWPETEVPLGDGTTLLIPREYMSDDKADLLKYGKE